MLQGSARDLGRVFIQNLMFSFSGSLFSRVFPSLSGSSGVPELLFLVLPVMKRIGFLFNGNLAF